ncbi:MAG: DMT family transporter [Pseudomonadota bacterium]|nr:DMT family transporter [Pseudomonadota bacterium]
MQIFPAAARGRGVVFYLIAIFLFALNDAMGKWLVASYAVGQLLALRVVGAAFLLAPMVWRWKVDLTDRRHLGLQIIRVLFMAADTYCFFYATRSMPLADVMTFYMAAPIIITALSALTLGEEVEPIRWAAIGLGFIGVLVALRPSADIFATSSPIALAGAIMYGLGQTITRALRGVHWLHLIVWQFGGAGLIGAATLPFAFVTPSPGDLALLFLLGVVAMVCFVFMTKALALTPASVLAPFQYTAILWATILGWLVWRDTPTTPILIGNALIIASGLIVLRAERARLPTVRDAAT